MDATIRVDLHCHSVYSDGSLTPRELAELAAGDGVAVAALTDHDSVDGLSEFVQTLARREVGFIAGVEITTHYSGEEVHLLAYGFDPAHPELRTVLHALRQARAPGVQSIAGTIRRRSSHPAEGVAVCSIASDGRIELGEAIALVHRAGGLAFLAHPLLFQSDIVKLERSLIALKEIGLDGIEAIYGPFSEEQRSELCDLSKRLGLLVSAGTDSHDRKLQSHESFGVEMPDALWREFRDAVCSGAKPSDKNGPSETPGRARSRLHWRDFVFHFVFPTLIAIALFITAIYAVFIPAFEKSLLDRKREMIRELTNSAWSILAAYEQDERVGRLTREQAQAMAQSQVELLRYGSERKDYFWLQDMSPRIIMHPYRSDLNGKDVSDFRDPRGVRIFAEFADQIRRGREGYVDYVWQWKDDPNRLVPKESYIKGFQPWGWIIGTGIYVEDVEQEIKLIERNLVRTFLGISLVVVLLLFYVVRQSLGLEKERADAEESLVESIERYRSLVEATTEGTLLVMDGRCRYANPIFLELIGSVQGELELLDLSDLFPRISENAVAWKSLERLLHGEEATESFDAVLRRRDGVSVEAVVATSRISFSERSGFILLVRKIGLSAGREGSRTVESQGWRYLQQMADNAPIGLFRARATSRGTLVECNRVALQLLRWPETSGDAPVALVDLFPNPRAYEEFLQQLRKTGTAAHKLHVTAQDLSSRTLAVAAVLAADEQGGCQFMDGVVEEISEQEKRLREMEGMVERLQTSLLFLHEPISRIVCSAVFCSLDTPIRSVSAVMTEKQTGAVVIQSETGNAVGIVTDADIRERVIAAGLDPREHVYRIMSSPLITVPERAQIYEALMLMEQKGVQHLAVVDEAGGVVGIVRNQETLQFRSYGPVVLAREVQQAATPEEVAAGCRRVPGLAKALLDSGAHPQNVTRMISSVCDAATLRLIALAEDSLGPVPVPYTFVALGSHGRQEMTLASDQDNAIVYEAPADPEENLRAETYLNELGRFVCDWLDRAGYPLCPGDVMARNPKWCKSLTVWKQYFSDWIALPDPQQLLKFTIFFDFRPVYGSERLSRELRRHVFDALRSQLVFYPHFAQNSLQFRPPTRLFGKILAGGGAAENPGSLDLKEALMPIVSFARLYALRSEMDCTHTLDRLNALVDANILQEQSCQDIASAYEYLMRLRLQHQAALLDPGQVADNLINYRRLTQIEQTLLNQSFGQITAIQKRISYDFLGGTA